MTLEQLFALTAKPTKFEWQGETVYLRKITARDGAALTARIVDLAKQDLGAAQDLEATFEYHAGLVSKSLCDEHGTLLCDTDEGRESLKARLSFDLLEELANLVLQHNGFNRDAKKN
jgi:hypothetical protein